MASSNPEISDNKQVPDAPLTGSAPYSLSPPPYPNQAPPYAAPFNGQYPPYSVQGGFPNGQPFYQPQHQTPGVLYATPAAPNQQQVVVMGSSHQPLAPNIILMSNPNEVSMVGPIILSCFVFWIFGYLFGGIAFILALIGQSSASAGDTRGALRMRNASYGMSIAGFVVAIIIISVVVSVSLSSPNRYPYSYCYSTEYHSYYRC